MYQLGPTRIGSFRNCSDVVGSFRGCSELVGIGDGERTAGDGRVLEDEVGLTLQLTVQDKWVVMALRAVNQPRKKSIGNLFRINKKGNQ